MKRYTLEEADKLERMGRCVHGHDWGFINMRPDEPVAIYCRDCYWRGNVTMGERPKRPEGVDV